MCSKLVLTTSLALISLVRSHSWVSCTDYQADIQGGDYTHSECDGWIRGWSFQNVVFASDRGVNHQVGVGSGQPLCQRTLNGNSGNGYSGSYLDSSKLTQYTAGETVRVVWPAKNHANYECMNFIPDTSMKLFMNPQVNPTSDLSNDESTMIAQGYELVKDWHDGCTPGTDDCGFQNCRRYCDDTDAAVCFGDFTVPNVDTSGYYTFVWYWIFNPGSPYISCWEAYIDADGSGNNNNTPEPTTSGNNTPEPTTSGNNTPEPTTSVNITPEPVTTNTGDGITIRNFHATQVWWLAFYVEDVECATVINVYIMDSGSYSDKWYPAANSDGYWKVENNGNQFSTPLTVRIATTNNQIIDLDNIITSFASNEEFTSTASFCNSNITPEPTNTPEPTDVITPEPTSDGSITPEPTNESNTPSGNTCIDDSVSNFNWESKNNQLYLNDQLLALKGLSWFGFETTNYNLYGLDVHNQDWYLNWMTEHGFNLMRVPFSQDFVDGGESRLTLLDDLIDNAADYGILIMLDYHSMAAGQYTEGFPFNDQETVKNTWISLAQRYGDRWNVFMADLFNEPHDVSSSQWDTWIEFCEDIMNELINNQNVNWLAAVQGTDANCASISGCSSSSFCNWGENLRQLSCGRSNQVDLDVDYRVVYTPHVYGPNIGGNSYGSDVWEDRWGFIVDDDDIEGAIMLGEFGTTNEWDWLSQLVDYLIDIDQRNTFYWCLNPNSGDTGGLLQSDWTTEETTKLMYLDELQPNPTLFTYNSNTGQVCLDNATPSPNETPSPVGTPTKAPVGNGISITNQQDSQVWWLAFYIDDLDCGTITSVTISDNSNYNNEIATYNGDDNPYWHVNNNGNRFNLPITIEITNSNNDIVTLTDIITNWDDNHVFTSSYNFCNTNAGTPEPTVTSPTTAQPTSSNDDDGITIQNFSGSNNYWFSLIVYNTGCSSIDTVEIRDDNDNSDWIVGSYNSGGNFYFFTENTPYSLPMDVRITSVDGDVVTKSSLIDSYDSSSIFFMGSDFCSSSKSSSNSATSSEEATIYGVVGGIVALLLIILIVGGIWYYNKKNKKPKPNVVEMDKHIMTSHDPHVTEGHGVTTGGVTNNIAIDESSD